MKPLNYLDIRRMLRRFQLLFAGLLAFTLLAAYSFVWAGDVQDRAIRDKVFAHRQMQRKQLLLEEKTDSLYTMISYLEKDKVDNYLFLEQYLLDYRMDILQLIGGDSATRFALYDRLVYRTKDQMMLKDTVVRLSQQEALLKADLMNCIARSKTIRKDLYRRIQPAR